MTWFLIALIPPALWSATNHIDKFLIAKYFKGGSAGALIIFSSLIGLFVLPFIVIFQPEVLDLPLKQAIPIIFNAAFYISALIPYFYALEKDEASITVPLFQLIPVITYALAWAMLGETLTKLQMFGGVFIIIGAIALSIDLNDGKKIRLRKEVLFLMFLSSFLFALNYVLFKKFAIDASYWTTSFWEYVGFVFFALMILIFIKPYRQQFFQVFKNNKLTVISINGVNETLGIIAKLTMNYASLLNPITLTWLVNGIQPFFVFIYGVFLTIVFPHITKEKITGRDLVQKLTAIVIIFIGTYLINQN